MGFYVRFCLPCLAIVASTACGNVESPTKPDAPIVDEKATITIVRQGDGTVTASAGGIDCGSSCSAEYDVGTSLTLTATSDSGSTFEGWTGAGCSGTGPCTIVVTADMTITASFAAGLQLMVTKTGTGAGTVTSAPAGIDCGSDCSEVYDPDTVVTLTATPTTGSTFDGWSGACTGTATCQVTITESKLVTATFALTTYPLTVAKTGTGTGTVTGTGIDCGSDCTETVGYNTMVTLTAMPSAGSTFTGWSGGGCSGTGTCTTTITAATTVTATFAIATYTLTVALDGNGIGTVNSTGIACPGDCTETLAYGTMRTLTATPSMPSSVFVGWTGGGCTGTGTCTTTITDATTITATFALVQHPLTVTTAGAGTGTVTATGIDCGMDCTESYDHGTIVALAATPAADSTFVSWSGACTGSGACNVTMTAARNVTATFALKKYTLTVVKAGTGAGTVTSSPAGITCGGDCTENYDAHTIVTLTAAPAASSTFTGWSNGCTGTGSCVVTMEAATSVTATFAVKTYALTVTRAGAGTGTVTSSPAGINCGADCSEMYNHGTVVVLTAAASVGNFAGWSGGGCSGTGSCTVTMTAATSVTATFGNTVRLTVSKTGLPAGAVVTSSPAGITCGATCFGDFAAGTNVTLTTTVAGSIFTGWSGGGCTGTGNCVVDLQANTTVTANYRGARVALAFGPSTSCLRAASQSGPIIASLLAGRGHTATFVDVVDIDTAAEIGNYDVVVLGGSGDPGCINNTSFTSIDAVLAAYVQAGGGLVAAGWNLYSSPVVGASTQAALPTAAGNGYFSGTQTIAPVAGHPITAGINAFSSGEWVPWGAGTKMGATPLLRVGAQDIAAAWAVGTGRSAFIGPMYFESYNAYQNENLLDGTQPNANELILRAIEWNADAR